MRYLALPFCAFFLSCGGIEGKLKLIEGNFFFSRSMFNEAVASYMEAQKDAAAAPYADFALGTSYIALEQNNAALDRFLAAEEGAEALKGNAAAGKNLLFNIRYNKGIVRFQQGDFSGAAEDFKDALLLKSSNIEAKRNLELSLLSLYIKNNSQGVQEKGLGSIADERDRARSEIIFDFIRQKEIDKWKSWEWAGPEDEDMPDY